MKEAVEGSGKGKYAFGSKNQGAQRDRYQNIRRNKTL